jgi:hypothetical protein
VVLRVGHDCAVHGVCCGLRAVDCVLCAVLCVMRFSRCSMLVHPRALPITRRASSEC